MSRLHRLNKMFFRISPDRFERPDTGLITRFIEFNALRMQHENAGIILSLDVLNGLPYGVADQYIIDRRAVRIVKSKSFDGALRVILSIDKRFSSPADTVSFLIKPSMQATIESFFAREYDRFTLQADDCPTTVEVVVDVDGEAAVETARKVVEQRTEQRRNQPGWRLRKIRASNHTPKTYWIYVPGEAPEFEYETRQAAKEAAAELCVTKQRTVFVMYTSAKARVKTEPDIVWSEG